MERDAVLRGEPARGGAEGPPGRDRPQLVGREAPADAELGEQAVGHDRGRLERRLLAGEQVAVGIAQNDLVAHAAALPSPVRQAASAARAPTDASVCNACSTS